MSVDVSFSALSREGQLYAFRPTLKALDSLLHQVTFSGQGDKRLRDEFDQKILELEGEIGVCIGRRLAVGFPPCKPNYKDGTPGWEFDVTNVLSAIRRTMLELTKASAEFPIEDAHLTRDEIKNPKSKKTWSEARSDLFSARERLEKHRDELVLLERQIEPTYPPHKDVTAPNPPPEIVAPAKSPSDTSHDTRKKVQKYPKRGPRNSTEYLRFKAAIEKGMKRDRSKRDIAMEFTNGDEDRAKALLRQFYRQTNLPE